MSFTIGERMESISDSERRVGRNLLMISISFCSFSAKSSREAAWNFETASLYETLVSERNLHMPYEEALTRRSKALRRMEA